MKNKRVWLTDQTDSDSSITLSVHDSYLDLKLRDCSRSIEWSFYFDERRKTGNARKSLAKIRRVKAVIDEMEAFLAEKVKK